MVLFSTSDCDMELLLDPGTAQPLCKFDIETNKLERRALMQSVAADTTQQKAHPN
jgi:predicted house-cleaning NTP pyrophosphatase (Maf/HAM1 superfamily)